MTVAIVNESSAAHRNADILRAIEPLGRPILNVGMKSPEDPALNYVQTAFLGALVLNSGRADYLIGGCATGQGFVNAVVQYPKVVCGLIVTPLDAWLFSHTNAGNAVSLRLNQDYGWGAEVNLELMFQHLFVDQSELGYPPHRKEIQREGREMLAALSVVSHKTMAQIVEQMAEMVIRPVLEFPGVLDILDTPTLGDRALADSLERRLARWS